MGGSASVSGVSGSDQWAVDYHEREGAKCHVCNVTCMGLQWVTHMFKDDPDYKTYVWYERAAADVDYRISGEASSCDSGTKLVRQGAYIIKIMCKSGDHSCCIRCFQEKHSTVFRSIALSLIGKAYMINSDITLNPASVGHTRAGSTDAAF